MSDTRQLGAGQAEHQPGADRESQQEHQAESVNVSGRESALVFEPTSEPVAGILRQACHQSGYETARRNYDERVNQPDGEQVGTITAPPGKRLNGVISRPR